MKSKYMIIIVFMILMVASVQALDSNGQGSSPFFNADYDSNFSRDITSIVGQDKFPLICDLDGGGEKEYITYEGTTLYIYKLESSGLELRANFNTGKTIFSIDCTVDPFDVDLDGKQILVAHPNTISGYGLSGETIGLVNDYYTFNDTQTSLRDFYCVDRDYVDAVDFYCSIGNGTDIFWIPSNTVPYQGFSPFSFEQSNGAYTILDFNNDLIYTLDDDDVKVCNVYSKRLDGSNVSCTTIDTPTNLNSDARIMQGYETSTGTIVCHMYDDLLSSYGDIEATCYSANSTLYNKLFTGDNSVPTDARNIIFYDLDIDGSIDTCFNFVYNNGVETTKCYDLTGTEIVVSQNLDSYLRGIGNIKEIDNPYLIYYDFANSEVDFIDADNAGNTETVSFNDDKTFVLSRLDSDNQQEIIGESSTGLVVYYALSTAVDDIDVNTSALYDGLYGFYNPTCENTNVNIKAKECIDTESCTYTNNNDEPYVRERLCTTCAGTVSEYCGAWSYTEPLVNCTFTTSGTKSIEVDLYTDTNPSTVAHDFASFDLVVQTSNCDQSDDFVSVPVPPSNETPTETPDEEQELSDKAAAILDNIFLIVGLIFTIAILAVMGAQGVKHPLIHGLAGFGLTCIFGLIGWYPVEFVILLTVGLAALAIIVGLFSGKGD